MKDRTQENLPTKVGEGTSWLVAQAEKDTSLDMLSEWRILQVIRLVQPLSTKAKKAGHDEGAALLSPGMIPLVGPDVWFTAVPLFMFPEYRKYRDRRSQEEDFIIARTLDARDEIALKSKDKTRRNEPYPKEESKHKQGEPPYAYAYCEVLCYVIQIWDKQHPLHGKTCVLEFQKGSHFLGMTYATACGDRQVEGHKVPLWSQLWEFKSAQTENANGDEYWIPNFRNPDGELFITEDEGPVFKAAHERLKKEYLEKTIVVDTSGDGDLGEDTAVDDDLGL